VERKEQEANLAMKNLAPRPGGGASPEATAEDRMSLLRLMTLARASEQRARTLLARETDAAPAASGHREPVAAGAVAALRAGDCIVAPARYAAAHLGLDEIRSVGRSSSAADLVPTAVGIALAVSGRGSNAVVLTLLDAGGLAGARWSDALAIATDRQLPLVLVVERPGPPTPLPELRQPLLGEAVDAADPEQVLSAVLAAGDRARGGRGPALVMCVAPTLEGPRPTSWRSGPVAGPDRAPSEDPIERYAHRLLQLGVPRVEIGAVIRAARNEVMRWTL
jgi:TPP-dependent pyruvate/acetoin dehydrogenase alpha subunit